jgi:hypothetical protein
VISFSTKINIEKNLIFIGQIIMTEVTDIIEENKKLKNDLSLLQEFIKSKEKIVGDEKVTQTDYEYMVHNILSLKLLESSF